MIAINDIPKPLIIGIGNPFRGDDGVGLAVIRRLKEDDRFSESMRVIAHTGDGTYLMDLWEKQNNVIIVDAAHGRGQPGTVYRFHVSETDFLHAFVGSSSHSFGVVEAIELARAINRLPEQLVIFAIEGATFDYGASLSAEVTDTIDNVVKQILAECSITV